MIFHKCILLEDAHNLRVWRRRYKEEPGIVFMKEVAFTATYFEDIDKACFIDLCDKFSLLNEMDWINKADIELTLPLWAEALFISCKDVPISLAFLIKERAFSVIPKKEDRSC